MVIKEVQTRIFVAPADFDAAVAQYVALTGGKITLHFTFPERELQLTTVSSAYANFLIISGPEDALRIARQTQLTALVDDITAVEAHVAAIGAELLQEPTPVPTGFQARARHAGGLVIEYVQHTASESNR